MLIKALLLLGIGVVSLLAVRAPRGARHLAMRRKDLPQATREFERAVDLQPYSADLLVVLADLYVAQGHVDQARDRLQEAVRFAPQNQSARQRLGALQGR